MEEQNIADKRLEEVNVIINDYVKKLGVNIQASSDDISHYFSMSADQIRSITAEECDIAVILLNQKATQIQVEINHHNRIKNWAEENINAFISNKLSHDQFIKYEAKRIVAIQQNDYTNKLHLISRTAKSYLDALEYLPMSIKNHADFFLSLSKSKRQKV